MEGKKLLVTRRSIRKFKNQEVTKEVLEEIISQAAFAPSWKNTQITRYVAVTGDKKAQIANEAVPEHNQTIINEVPMLLVITAIKSRSGFERDGSFSTKKEDRWQNFDCGIATQTLCLAAHDAGLGTVILGIFDEDKVREIIGLSEDREIMALVPIGYPDEEPAAPKRKTVEDLLSYLS